MPYPFAVGCRAPGGMTEHVVVTGGFGLVGSQTVRQLVADGHRVVATDLGTSAQRKAAESLPAEPRRAGRPDGPGAGRPPRCRDGPDGDHPPGRRDPTRDISPPETGPTGQRRRDRGTVARREDQPAPGAFHPGLEQRRARRPQPAPAPGAGARRHSGPSVGPLRRPQGRGRAACPRLGSSVGDPAPRRCLERTIWAPCP